MAVYVEQRQGISIGRCLLRLSVMGPARTADCDDEAAWGSIEGEEVPGQQLAQLILPGQPDDVVRRDRVQSPLDRPVEVEARLTAPDDQLHDHVTDQKYRVRDLRLWDEKLVAVGGRPREIRCQLGRQVPGDHARSIGVDVSAERG